MILYRIAQEALVNVKKHADASHVAIRLRDGAGILMRISDDGVASSSRTRPEPVRDISGLDR